MILAGIILYFIGWALMHFFSSDKKIHFAIGCAGCCLIWTGGGLLGYSLLAHMWRQS